VIVRQYFGRTQDDAVARYAADAVELAGQGYLPVSQSWAYGQWPTLLIVLSVILCIFIVGFLLVALMLISKPDGTLAVTYVLQGTQREPIAAPRPPGIGT
jgi:hypothetical protein